MRLYKISVKLTIKKELFQERANEFLRIRVEKKKVQQKRINLIAIQRDINARESTGVNTKYTNSL